MVVDLEIDTGNAVKKRTELAPISFESYASKALSLARAANTMYMALKCQDFTHSDCPQIRSTPQVASKESYFVTSPCISRSCISGPVEAPSVHESVVHLDM